MGSIRTSVMLEVNLRKGGTIHPYSTLSNLVPGRCDAGLGAWLTRHVQQPRAYELHRKLPGSGFPGAETDERHPRGRSTAVVPFAAAAAFGPGVMAPHPNVPVGAQQRPRENRPQQLRGLRRPDRTFTLGPG